jgi:uncharacterized membrane protein YeaQ/YmgE (transglycosylase-associated protein family)
MDILWTCLIGIVAGFLAGQVMKGGGYGLIGDLIVGLIGGFVGGWLFKLLHLSLPFDVLIGQLIVAFIGAVVLLLAIRMIKKA